MKSAHLNICFSAVIIFSLTVPCTAQTDIKSDFDCQYHENHLNNQRRSAKHFSSVHALQSLNPIIPDFQLSENIGGAVQYNPKVVCNGSGNTIVVWDDMRDGHHHIYAQTYINGVADGENFRFDSLSSSGAIFFNVAIAENGNFIFVWYGSYQKIYARQFSANGLPLTDKIQTNEGEHEVSTPSIGIDDRGNYTIIWRDRRLGWSSVYAQRYDNLGNPIGSNFKVDDNIENLSVRDHNIAVSGNGSFIITWSDKRMTSGFEYIYAQVFNAEGSAVGSNIQISDKGGRNPIAAADSIGNFAIGWQKTWIQLIDSSGSQIGWNKSTGITMTDIEMNEVGQIVITGMDINNDDEATIYTQYFSKDGKAQSQFYPVSTGTFRATNLVVALDNNGEAFHIWRGRETQDTDNDIFLQRSGFDGTVLGTTTKVNDDSEGSGSQFFRQLSVYGQGDFVALWEQRLADRNYFLRYFSKDGTPVSSTIRVTDRDEIKGHLHEPFIATNNNGEAVVTWKRCVSGDDGIMFQRYDNQGNRIGLNTKIRSSDSRASHPAHAAINDSNYFVLIWYDGYPDFSSAHPFETSVYGQCFAPNGDTISSIIQISSVKSDTKLNTIWNPSLVLYENGDFVVAWEDDRSGSRDIYTQRFQKGGIPIGGNVKINDDVGVTEQTHSFILKGQNDEHFIVWEDERSGEEEIYAQRFSKDWNLVGTNFKVDDTRDTYYVHWDMDENGKAVSVWEHDGDIYGQRYDANLAPVGDVFIVHGAPSAYQIDPHVQVYDGKIYTAWSDNRIPGYGYSVWGNILDWNSPPTWIEESDRQTYLTEYTLHPNFPNPFNPATTISFNLPEASEVILKIFDLKGRDVAVLLDGQKKAGEHQVEWNASGMPSGIYLARLKAGSQTRTKKLVLQK